MTEQPRYMIEALFEIGDPDPAKRLQSDRFEGELDLLLDAVSTKWPECKEMGMDWYVQMPPYTAKYMSISPWSPRAGAGPQSLEDLAVELASAIAEKMACPVRVRLEGDLLKRMIPAGATA